VISIDRGIPLPQQVRAPGYCYGTVVRWQPGNRWDPPPQPQGDRVEVRYRNDIWCEGEIEMVINDDDEDLFRAHPLFRASAGH